MVTELTKSVALPAHNVGAPKSTRAEILKVAFVGVLVSVRISTLFEDHVKRQGPRPVKAACKVSIWPLHTAVGPRRLTADVGLGLMMSCTWTRSAGELARPVRRSRAEAKNVLVIAL